MLHIKMHKTILIGLIYTILELLRYIKLQYIDNQLYYQEPLLNIKFMNLTLVGSFPFVRTDTALSEVTDEAGLLTAICQADKFNRKQYADINFNGIINIAAQDYNISDSVGQDATVSLFKNSLFNITTKQTISPDGIYNLAGFFGGLGAGINRIHAQVTAGNLIPFIDPGTIDLLNFADKSSVTTVIENKTYYGIRDTSIYNSVNVALAIMKAYDWTICANIFQDNVLGLAAQQEFQTYADNFSSPIFTCNKIITADNILNIEPFISDICICMNNIDTLTVINIWTDPIVAYSLIAAFKTKCSTASKFVFIMTGESKPLPPNFYKDPDIYKTTLVIRPFGPWNFTAYIDECLTTSSPQAVSAMTTLINQILLNSFNCYTYSNGNSTLPICTNSLIGRLQPCICSGTEFDPKYNIYSAQNFFFADAISTYAYVISLVQNNCSYVNEMVALKNLILLEKIDFCKLENLTPRILTEILALTDFTGYTGKINFPTIFNTIRAYKTFFLYNIQSTIFDSVLVGNFSIDGYFLNKSAILLPSGNNTISELVPQNPNIYYASIAVFFGIQIFLLIFSIIAFYILIVNLNHSLIRRNTPNMSIAVLIGTMSFLVSNIILCTGLYDATCILYLFFTNIGLALIIGGIIAKSYRIYRIFNNRTAVAVIISDFQLILIVAVIALYFAILSVLILVAGIQATTDQSSTNRFYLFVRCAIPNQFWNTFFIIWSEASFFILRIVAMILAWSTRHVVSSYSEAETVMALMTLYICLDISFLPLFFTLQDGTDSAVLRACVKLIYYSITATVTLVLLFYSRFYKVTQYNKKLQKRLARENHSE